MIAPTMAPAIYNQNSFNPVDRLLVPREALRKHGMASLPDEGHPINSAALAGT